MSANSERRVLILPPTRRDGQVTCSVLERMGLVCKVCDGSTDLAHEIEDAVGVIVLTDAALSDLHIDRVIATLGRQPPWSDVPIVLLVQVGAMSRAAKKVLESLTNVTLLDRPTSTRTLVSSIEAAVRGRDRQYQIRDQLTEQLAVEEALRVRERQLRTLAEALSNADQRKDEFLATLAHELRNPLAPLRTGLQVLARSTAESPATVRVREMMERQLRQLVRLIDDLLDVSRISSGKVVLRRERIDLNAVVAAALEASQPFVEAGNHQLKVEYPLEPVWVDGDPSRLSQVVSNLVNNASKYTPNGGRIAVSLARDGGEAAIRVADNGAGIPAEMLTEVFEMFAQVNRTVDRAQGGLGIGLSLVRRLMELHGGSVTAMSPGLGGGSTFTIRLAVASAPAIPPGAPPPEAPRERCPRPGTGGLRMLVVDDNEDGATSLAMLLSLEGHETRTEYSGAGALVAARDFKPHVIFCDIGLPKIDGHEVARRLRADPAQTGVMLVALTGWGSAEDKRRTREAGFDVHLTKPVAAGEVEKIIVRALDRYGAGASARGTASTTH